VTRLAGAHVLVTGGSEGIGLATAGQLLARGARVSLVSRSAQKLAAAQGVLGGSPAVEPANVTDAPGLQSAVDRLVARQGPVDVLVAAAGGAEPGHVERLDLDVLRRQMDLNYFGAVHAVRAVLPPMLERRRGHVVLVSSVAGLVGVFGYGGYGPAKAALRNLADVLEAEHGDSGVRVGVVYPPDTLTPGFERENRTKPPATAAVSAMVAPLSADRVAAALVRGIERDRRTITADRSSAALARATSVLAPAVRLSMRRTVRRSRE
jgi:3-dehydrosphinganine reductase